MQAVHALPVQRGCRCVGLSRTAWYRRPEADHERDADVIGALNAIVERHPRWGFWKCYYRLRLDGRGWNHKRVHRVYCQMGLNLPRRTKRRLPLRVRAPLDVPQQPNEVWSADFVHDTLYSGKRFRTFTLIDDHNREGITIEIDTSLTGSRLVRVFEQLRAERPLPAVLRVDNGPEFLSTEFITWAENAGMAIRYIQPGKPNQNAYIERFNRTYREEVLNQYLFRDLDEVREITHWWLIDYNERRPHESLAGETPASYLTQNAENSALAMCP